MKVMALAPAARPSSPSVRLTALVLAVMSSQIHNSNSAVGRTIGVSRTRLTAFDAGVRPYSSGHRVVPYANVSATKAWPMSLVRARMPVDRCLKIFR